MSEIPVLFEGSGPAAQSEAPDFPGARAAAPDSEPAVERPGADVEPAAAEGADPMAGLDARAAAQEAAAQRSGEYSLIVQELRSWAAAQPQMEDCARISNLNLLDELGARLGVLDRVRPRPWGDYATDIRMLLDYPFFTPKAAAEFRRQNPFLRNPVEIAVAWSHLAVRSLRGNACLVLAPEIRVYIYELARFGVAGSFDPALAPGAEAEAEPAPEAGPGPAPAPEAGPAREEAPPAPEAGAE